MNKSHRTALLWPTFTALAVPLLIAAISYALWSHFPGQSDGATLAAWIQAIGSIIAIFGAFFIGKVQVSDAQRIEAKARLNSILAIAEAAHQHAVNIAGELTQCLPGQPIHATFYNVYDKTIVDGMVRALTGIPMHEIGSGDGVLALLDLTDQFTVLGTTVERLLNRWSDPEYRNLLAQIPADDREQRSAVINSTENVLHQNIRRRLDRIQMDFTNFRNAVEA